MNYTSYVDVFHGWGNIDLPKPEGTAATWHFIKALCGNTHPGAILPFGKYSVAPYSSGYSSGYGVNCVNTHLPAPALMDTLRLRGFSHFHNSGSGGIGVYYNYAVVTPYLGEKKDFYDITDETGKPGYYAVTFPETGIRCELSADKHAALHRYTFPAPGGKISINFSNNGLYDGPRMRGTVSDLSVERVSSNELFASAVLEDIRFYFVCRFTGNGELGDDGIYTVSSAGSVTLTVSISAASKEDAYSEANASISDFDTVKANAHDAWESALGKIRIETSDENEKRLFYSNMYHSLVKPCDWEGGGFLWQGAPFVTDFITLWDMYKTALPLIFSLFPEVSSHIADTYNKLGDTLGTLPNCFMLANNFNLESKQARLAAVHMLYDAWIRGVDADWEAITRHILRAIFSDANKDYTENHECERTTHTLDMAESCAAAAEMTEALGMTEEAERLRNLKGGWRVGFDPKTGLLLEGRTYYEGDHWNYSFRPLREMDARIELCGGKEKFEALLDRFFGFTYPDDLTARFEGFNNETDMEAPYAYAYIGRHDKLCQILREADLYMFRTSAGTTGSGGIPGNNDSGGLSSCYLWNTLGLFPVSGQNLMHIARPKFECSVMQLANGKELTIVRRGSGLYPVSAVFNGIACDKLRLSVTEMMQGGELIIET